MTERELKEMVAPRCGRCGKHRIADIHTCTPTEWARDMEEKLREAERQREGLLAALRSIVAVCESSMKTHGYDKAHAKNRVTALDAIAAARNEQGNG